MTSHTGRPRTQPWRLFFVLAALSAYTEKKVMLTRMNALAAGLTPSQRWNLEMTVPVSYPQLERMLNDLVLALREQSDVDLETGEVHCDPLTTKPLLTRRLNLEMDELLTAIVAAAIPPHIPPTPGAAIDSTDLETMSKRMSWANDDPDITGDHLPPNPKGPRSSINTAGWPRISPTTQRRQHTKDQDATEGWRTRKNAPGDEIFVGYDLHLITDTSTPADNKVETPFIRAVAIAPAGTLKSVPGLSALRHYIGTHGTPTDVFADRGYTYLKPAHWADPLIDLDICTTIDLHTNQRGVHPGPFPATIWVDGGLFSDSLPITLRKLPAITWNMDKERKSEAIGQYEARRPYRYENHGRPQPNRRQRVMGPVKRGKMRCPNSPRSMRNSPASVPTTTCKPGHQCSCDRVLTLGPNDLTQLRQRYPYGTRKWATEYARRVHVEAANAMIKRHHGNISRGVIHVRGQAKSGLLISFMIGCSNLRCAEDQGRHPLPPPPNTSTPKDPPQAHANNDPTAASGTDPPARSDPTAPSTLNTNA